MKYLPIENEFFIENRQSFANCLKPNSLAIFHSNDKMPRSADGFFPFRQNADLFYLSGIDQEQTILLLYPDCPDPLFKEVLFVRKTNSHIAVWEGHKYTIEEARQTSGIENILWLEEFEANFSKMVHSATNLYVNLNEHDRYQSDVPYRNLRLFNTLKEKYPAHNYERSAPIMARLRSIKSETEIKLMQKAINITEKAFRRAMKCVKPGIMEYEVEAEIFHEFISNRATGHAYPPIIASGKNGCVLHYIENNKECKDGDVLLMDFGAEYANYAADLTRCIPVNGKFTDRQRNVYNAVLRVLKEAKQLLVPGNTLDVYNKEVGKIMEEELIKLGLLNPIEVSRQNPDHPLYKKYFMHGTSHHLGLDVHDVGKRHEPIKAGMVFTCEPGIYIPEEKLAIRLENNIFVTENGPLDLTNNIPIEPDEIEELMSQITTKA